VPQKAVDVYMLKWQERIFLTKHLEHGTFSKSYSINVLQKAIGIGIANVFAELLATYARKPYWLVRLLPAANATIVNAFVYGDTIPRYGGELPHPHVNVVYVTSI
jgi:hypothetical protein